MIRFHFSEAQDSSWLISATGKMIHSLFISVHKGEQEADATGIKMAMVMLFLSLNVDVIREDTHNFFFFFSGRTTKRVWTTKQKNIFFL